MNQPKQLRITVTERVAKQLISLDEKLLAGRSITDFVNSIIAEKISVLSLSAPSKDKNDTTQSTQ